MSPPYLDCSYHTRVLGARREGWTCRDTDDHLHHHPFLPEQPRRHWQGAIIKGPGKVWRAVVRPPGVWVIAREGHRMW